MLKFIFISQIKITTKNREHTAAVNRVDPKMLGKQ